METASLEEIQQKANQCVQCGLCLNHCPTFQTSQDENRSPRGRIALIQAVYQKKLPLTANIQAHLDSCLQCLACESVCPAHVDYSSLIHQAKTNLIGPTPLSTGWHYLLHPIWRQLFHRGLYWLEKTGLRTLARRLGFIAKLGLKSYDEILPPIPKPTSFSKFYPAQNRTGSVRLWTGCLTSLIKTQTLMRTLTLLNYLGMDVHLNTTCCGALWHHTGHTQEASRAYKKHESALSSSELWVGMDSACMAHLSRIYQRPVLEITQFVATHQQALAGRLAPWKGGPVGLHTPCSLQYPLQGAPCPKQLLSLIPNLTLLPLNSPGTCCGAAGYHMLKDRGQADAILTKNCDFSNTAIQSIATTNLGCFLHLNRFTKKQAPHIIFAHPIDYLTISLAYYNKTDFFDERALTSAR